MKIVVTPAEVPGSTVRQGLASNLQDSHRRTVDAGTSPA
jgi:hypothetical protein